jgi:hypothetical protein
MPDPAAQTLPHSDAWRMFEQWRSAANEIGVMFLGRHGSLATTGTVTSARMGRLQINSGSTEATFNLKDANFLYGPVQLFPRWPYPPPVEVIAVQAYFPSGDWLVLAEGFRPKSVPEAQSQTRIF